MGLAAYDISNTEVFAGLRAWVEKRGEERGGTWAKAAKGISCPWCVAHWVGLLALPLLFVPALSGAAVALGIWALVVCLAMPAAVLVDWSTDAINSLPRWVRQMAGGVPRAQVEPAPAAPESELPRAREVEPTERRLRRIPARPAEPAGGVLILHARQPVLRSLPVDASNYPALLKRARRERELPGELARRDRQLRFLREQLGHEPCPPGEGRGRRVKGEG